jgi:hypothetical protein
MVPKPQDVKEIFPMSLKMTSGDARACGISIHRSGVTGWNWTFTGSCGTSTGDARIYGTSSHRLEIVDANLP